MGRGTSPLAPASELPGRGKCLSPGPRLLRQERAGGSSVSTAQLKGSLQPELLIPSPTLDPHPQPEPSPPHTLSLCPSPEPPPTLHTPQPHPHHISPPYWCTCHAAHGCKNLEGTLARATRLGTAHKQSALQPGLPSAPWAPLSSTGHFSQSYLLSCLPTVCSYQFLAAGE